MANYPSYGFSCFRFGFRDSQETSDGTTDNRTFASDAFQILPCTSHHFHSGNKQSLTVLEVVPLPNRIIPQKPLILRASILAGTLANLIKKRTVDEQVHVGENEINIGILSTDQLFECVARIDR